MQPGTDEQHFDARTYIHAHHSPFAHVIGIIIIIIVSTLNQNILVLACLGQAIARQERLYEKRKWRLIGDNVFLGLLGTSGAWALSFKAACSYSLGALLGTAYLVLLSRFVENLGKEDQDGGGGRGGGGGGGPARLALAGLLVLIVSKNKDTFEFLPAIAGFLAYQVHVVMMLGSS